MKNQIGDRVAES